MTEDDIIEGYIKIAAEDIHRLRVQDVARVLSMAVEHDVKNSGDEILSEVQAYILKHRPEFENEIVQCLLEICYA